MAEPLGLVLFAAGHERVHYALSLAAAAAALDRPVEILVAGPAVAALGPAGWAALEDPSGAAAALAAAGAAGIEALWQSCGELGCRVTACETALATHRIDPGTLRAGVGTGGLIGFLSACAPPGQIVFV